MLNSVQQNNQKDVSQCCTKMFQLWLENDASASWTDLLEALKIMELFDLVTKIEALFMTGQ